MRMEPADRDRRHQPAKNRKLVRAHIPVKNLVCKGVSYEGKESTSMWHRLHVRGRIRPAITQDINGAKRKQTILEARPLSPKSETPLLRTRGQPRERFRRTIELLYRIRPEA